MGGQVLSLPGQPEPALKSGEPYHDVEPFRDERARRFHSQHHQGGSLFIEEFKKSLKDLKLIEKKDTKYVIAKNIKEVTVPWIGTALVLGRELQQPFSMVFALISDAPQHLLRREFQTTLEQAGEGISKICQALDWFKRSGMHVNHHCDIMLAEACSKLGRIDEGMAILDETQEAL